MRQDTGSHYTVIDNTGAAWYYGGMESFESAVEEVVRRHPEYAPDAYVFMREALDAAMERYAKQEGHRHLTAEELYTGACAYALDEYGPLATIVLESWGLNNSRDFGAVVYNLIEVGVFGRSKGDSREQFDNLPDLQELLNEPFQS